MNKGWCCFAPHSQSLEELANAVNKKLNKQFDLKTFIIITNHDFDDDDGSAVMFVEHPRVSFFHSSLCLTLTESVQQLHFHMCR